MSPSRLPIVWVAVLQSLGLALLLRAGLSWARVLLVSIASVSVVGRISFMPPFSRLGHRRLA